MAIPASERKAVMSVFNSPDYEELEEAEAADRIIEALNQVRENTKRFVVVASLKWPEDPSYHMWAAGPFNTENMATAVGQTFAADPATMRGKGRWKAVPILSPTAKPSRTAWDIIKPTPVDQFGWIKDDVGAWTWNNKLEGKVGW
jgi:hypothetical protein